MKHRVWIRILEGSWNYRNPRRFASHFITILEGLRKRGFLRDFFLILEMSHIQQKGFVTVLYQVNSCNIAFCYWIVILVGRDRRIGKHVTRESNESEYRPAFKRRGEVTEEMAQGTAWSLWRKLWLKMSKCSWVNDTIVFVS